MINNLDRYVEHLGEVREDLLPYLVIELEHEGLIVVETATVKENSFNSDLTNDYEKDDKEVN